MRVIRVKLERSAADLGMPGASGLPPPSSWPSDYWVQTCSDTSWRVVQSSPAVSLSSVVEKGKRFVALALVLELLCSTHSTLAVRPLPRTKHATVLVLSRPVIHYHTLLPTLSCLVPRASSSPLQRSVHSSLVSPRLVAFRPRSTAARTSQSSPDQGETLARWHNLARKAPHKPD